MWVLFVFLLNLALGQGQTQEQVDPCTLKSGVVGDFTYCDRYWECVGGTPQLYDCPNGLVFVGRNRGIAEGCDYPWRANECQGRTIANPPISTDHCGALYGIFGHETSCTRYWTCWNGTATEQFCIGGLLYHEDSHSCDWPENVRGCQKHPICAGNPFDNVPLGTSCQRYWSCQGGYPRLQRCSANLFFDKLSKRCTKELPEGCEPPPPPPPRVSFEDKPLFKPKQGNRARGAASRRPSVTVGVQQRQQTQPQQAPVRQQQPVRQPVRQQPVRQQPSVRQQQLVRPQQVRPQQVRPPLVQPSRPNPLQLRAQPRPQEQLIEVQPQQQFEEHFAEEQQQFQAFEEQQESFVERPQQVDFAEEQQQFQGNFQPEEIREEAVSPPRQEPRLRQPPRPIRPLRPARPQFANARELPLPPVSDARSALRAGPRSRRPPPIPGAIAVRS